MAALIERRKEVVASMMKGTVYDAAVAVLTEHGLAGLTMARVAAEADVATGSLYNYFANKDELLRYVHKRTIEPILQRGQEIVDSAMPALAKLDAIIRAWFEYSHEHQTLFHYLVTDEASRSVLKSQGQETHATAIDQLVAIIVQGIKDGVLRQIDPKRVAGFLLGAVHRTREEQLKQDEPWPIDQLTEDLLSVFVHGLTAEK